MKPRQPSRERSVLRATVPIPAGELEDESRRSVTINTPSCPLPVQEGVIAYVCRPIAL
jgi:hypothetical protein